MGFGTCDEYIDHRINGETFSLLQETQQLLIQVKWFINLSRSVLSRDDSKAQIIGSVIYPE